MGASNDPPAGRYVVKRPLPKLTEEERHHIERRHYGKVEADKRALLRAANPLKENSNV